MYNAQWFVDSCLLVGISTKVCCQIWAMTNGLVGQTVASARSGVNLLLPMMGFVLYREAMMEFFASVSRHPSRHHGNMEIPRPSSAPHLGPFSSPRRSEAYAPSLDSAERHEVTFVEDIERQAGMRNRQHEGQPELLRDAQDASSTNSNTTLTPSSNNDHEATRGSLKYKLTGIVVVINENSSPANFR
jgi:hypothetical protein